MFWFAAGSGATAWLDCCAASGSYVELAQAENLLDSLQDSFPRKTET